MKKVVIFILLILCLSIVGCDSKERTVIDLLDYKECIIYVDGQIANKWSIRTDLSCDTQTEADKYVPNYLNFHQKCTLTITDTGLQVYGVWSYNYVHYVYDKDTGYKETIETFTGTYTTVYEGTMGNITYVLKK